MPRPDDPQLIRLFDLNEHEAIEVRCLCGRITVFAPGNLQKRHRMRSDTLIYDVQYRLRCSHCARTGGFAIAIPTSARSLWGSATGRRDGGSWSSTAIPSSAKERRETDSAGKAVDGPVHARKRRGLP
jgi:hypothetical protein